MEKTRFKLNICGVDVTVSGDVDRDGAEAIAERVRVRMEEVLNNAYGATIEKAAVIAAMNLSEELSRTEAALIRPRGSGCPAHKDKGICRCGRPEGPPFRSGNKARRFAGKAAPCRKPRRSCGKGSGRSESRCQNAAHTAAAEPLDLPPIDLRNPMLPDYGDETGLVSFFEKADVKETAREDEED